MDDGHVVGCAPNVAFGPSCINFEGITIHAQGTGFSEAPAVEHYLHHGYDCLLAQYDFWPLTTLARLIKENRVISVFYVPLDHSHLSPAVGEKLTAATYLVTMCDFGSSQLKRANFTNYTRIYHGVDCETYHPLDPDKYPKERLRKELGFDCDFLIGIVKMNKGLRSAIPRQLEIIKTFCESNPDIKTGIYLHTDLNNPNGFNLESVLKTLGLDRITKVADPYLYGSAGYNDNAMSKMYNSCDVTMNCTYSEGLGMPIIEAAACGTPPISGNYTSMTELLKPVAPELLVDPDTITWQQVPARYFLVDMDKGVDVLEKVVNTDPSYYAKRLHEHAKKTFDWDSVIGPQWKKFFKTTLPDYIDENCLKIPSPSEKLKPMMKPMEIT